MRIVVLFVLFMGSGLMLANRMENKQENEHPYYEHVELFKNGSLIGAWTAQNGVHPTAVGWEFKDAKNGRNVSLYTDAGHARALDTLIIAPTNNP